MTTDTHKKQLLIIAGTIILAVILIWLGGSLLKNSPETQRGWYTVASGDVALRISIPAEVRPAQTVDLAFARSGTIATVPAHVGDQVQKGALLATLANADLNAQVGIAEANLESEQAKFDSLKLGSRPEDIATSQALLSQAQTSANEAGSVVTDKARDAYTVADDALNNLAGQLFTNPHTANPLLAFQTNDAKLAISLENDRVTMDTNLADWQTTQSKDSPNDPVQLAQVAGSNLRKEIGFFDTLSTALSGALTDSANTSATLASYRAAVALGRTNLNVALSSVVSAAQAYENAQAAVKTSESQLTLKRSGPTAQDLAAGSARVDSAAASVASAHAELAKTYIVAPFSGVITRVDAKSGAAGAANASLISLISSTAQIEGYLSEVDVAKVQKGDPVEVTLDAYGVGTSFPGHVLSVDPAPTTADSSTAYKTVIILDGDTAPGIKPGMHANVSIIAQVKHDVLVIPPETIITKIGAPYVELMNADGTTTLHPIKTGITGNMVEVTDGLRVGDKISSFGSVHN